MISEGGLLPLSLMDITLWKHERAYFPVVQPAHHSGKVASTRWLQKGRPTAPFLFVSLFGDNKR
jgi:hypothetical protein